MGISGGQIGFVTLLVALGPMVCGAVAEARQMFVEAGAIADHDPTLRSAPATTAGFAGAAGMYVSRRVSLHVEVDVPWWRVERHSRRWPMADAIETHDGTERQRARSVSALAGVHIPIGRRIRVVLLGGGTSVFRQWGKAGFVERRRADGTLISRVDYAIALSSHEWFAVTAGADASVAVTGRLAIVPQLRVSSYLFSDHTSLVFMRARLAARWTF